MGELASAPGRRAAKTLLRRFPRPRRLRRHGGEPPRQAAMTTRPNVIVFLTDQQRWDTSGLFGNPLELTPNFDRFAQAGTFVPHSFTCQPVCAPARASLQTGLYATSHGVLSNLHLPMNP